MCYVTGSNRGTVTRAMSCILVDNLNNGICSVLILCVLPYNRVQNNNIGHAVAQLVEALRYKPEGRGFDSRWCHWIFSLT